MQRLKRRSEPLEYGGLISVRRRIRLSGQIKTALGVVVVLRTRTHNVGVCYDSDRNQHQVKMSPEGNKTGKRKTRVLTVDRRRDGY